MDYITLLDLATDLGYELAMAGAETFRIEESIRRILASYGFDAEVFAIPNCLIVSIITEDGTPITRMRRIGSHGNDLDSVEKFSNLSRTLCSRKPDAATGMQWLEQTRTNRLSYSTLVKYIGYFLGAAGYAMFFGGDLTDGLFGGLCGMLVGLIDQLMEKRKANQFFRTIASSFLMALLAYALGIFNLTLRPDAVIIGALMLLVPGLLFTNAMRDIIYGDTNSGVNRIVQVFLIAVAIALGTASAWNMASFFWRHPVSVVSVHHSIPWECIFAMIGCLGFAILFNIHGWGGLLCIFGGVIAWCTYCLVMYMGGEEIAAYFWSALVSSVYSEVMARIRKYPAISYLVVSVFPLIPGAGVYYTMNYAVRGQMSLFASKGMHTAAIAGIMAVGILLGSTVFRMYSDWKMRRNK